MLLPEGPPLFDAEHLTDPTERFLAAEFVREQLFVSLRQEVPYAVALVIEEWNERAADVVISASIVVERETQRAIVLGGGAMDPVTWGPARASASASSCSARRTSSDWTTSPQAMAALGYRA